MRILLLFVFLFSTVSFYAQETFKVITYNVSGEFGKKTEALQGWMKTQAADVVAFQEVEKGQEDIAKIAKKWKHKYVAVMANGENNVVLTSKYPIKSSVLNGSLKASIEGFEIYAVQINQDSLKHRQASVDALTMDIKTQNTNNKKVLVLGHIEGYAKADSAIYSQRFRLVPVEDRANRKIIRQIASYSRSQNYDLLKRLSSVDLIDPILEKSSSEEIESTFPTKKMGTVAQYRTYRVDYVLLSENLKSMTTNAKVIRDKFTEKYAEHYPVMVELKL